MKGLVRAITRAMKEVLADPDAAVTLLAAIEPLMNKEIEQRASLYVYQHPDRHAGIAALGVGDVRRRAAWQRPSRPS